MGVKEKVISALQSNSLKWDADFEKAIDRLTALGMSDALGSALWRVKFVNDATSYKRALYLLVDKAALRPRLNGVTQGYITMLAKGAIHEWILDACEVCHGSGQVTAATGVVSSCSKCNATGIKCHTDWERQTGCGMKVWNEGHNKKFEEVLSCLTGSAAATGGRVADLLREHKDW